MKRAIRSLLILSVLVIPVGCIQPAAEPDLQGPIEHGEVRTVGVIIEKVTLGEYILESYQLGQRVILRPRLFEAMFLEPGTWVRVEGGWEGPTASAPAVIYDATVSVLPRSQ
ncbi:MAG: hypothetical protein ACLFUJ_06630 [Phycisphaerae bacterium]